MSSLTDLLCLCSYGLEGCDLKTIVSLLTASNYVSLCLRSCFVELHKLGIMFGILRLGIKSYRGVTESLRGNLLNLSRVTSPHRGDVGVIFKTHVGVSRIPMFSQANAKCFSLHRGKRYPVRISEIAGGAT